MSKMKSLVLVGVAIMLVFSLCACSKDSSSNAGGGASSGNIGEIKEITVADGIKISAICPKSWNDFSDQASDAWKNSLYFSEADEPGVYSKPYFIIKYSDIKATVGGNGEEVSIESNGATWTGLYDSSYKTFNLVKLLDDGTSATLMSVGMEEDNNIFKAVLASVKVTK